MIDKIIVISLSILSVVSAQWKNGDIIFTKTSGRQATAVKAATNSPWTHTAVIFLDQGKPMVFEAVQPVRVIHLEQYLGKSKKSNHQFMRLKNTSMITAETMVKAQKWAKKHVGKNYDGRFQWSDTTLYCSELVWKIFYECAGIELCKVKQVKDYDLEHPTVKKMITERFGSINKLNKDEKIVAPSDIYQSDLLVEFHPFNKAK